MIGMGARIAPEIAAFKNLIEQATFDLRVACPGIIVDFDPTTLTASVQPAIRENMSILVGYNGTIPVYIRRQVPLPLLIKVPVCYPKGGGYNMTFPINRGDECLVVFADSCIDGWWQSGGADSNGNPVSQNQLQRRRHDLSDGFCIPGPWSQTAKPTAPPSQSSIQLMTDDASTYFEIIDGQITSSANLNNPSAASTTFTDSLGRIMSINNGIVQNAEGSLTGLVNTKFFTQCTTAVNAARSIADLQRIVNDMFGGFNGIISDLVAQIAGLTAILPGSLSTLTDVITWIDTFKSVISGPIAQLATQQTALLANMTALSTAATLRASALGGSITIPPF